MGTGFLASNAQVRPTVIRYTSIPMRITHSEGEHFLVLTDAEAAVLVEVSALLVVASQSVEGTPLPPRMATLLGQLFESLKAYCDISAPPEGD